MSSLKVILISVHCFKSNHPTALHNSIEFKFICVATVTVTAVPRFSTEPITLVHKHTTEAGKTPF